MWAAGSGRLAGLLLVVFVLSSVGIVSAREPNRPIGDGKPSPALSEKDPNWRAGVRRRDARAKRLAGPVERRRREASRTAFGDVSRTGALALAERELPDLFETPLFDGAVPGPGMRVLQQGGKGAAVVEDVKTGKRVVLQSNVPLQTDDGGTMAPVDLSLETVGADLESDNAFVPLSVDRTSSAEVTFPESGFSVEVAGNAKDRLVQRSAGRLFFAETRPDTDALVFPTVMGAELGLVLRTEAAPERQVLDFDLPVGATLRRARVKDPIPGDPPGALEIRRDDKTIGYLGEPNVFDADGQSVRSRMAFRGDKVTIDVDHHGRDIRYPVFVDPEISVAGQFYSNWDGWNWSQALVEPRNYSLAEGYGATKNNCNYACGLYESHPTHTWNANNSYANWYYRAGPNTFIYRAVFGGTYHDGMLIGGRNHTDAFQGVVNSAYNAWESMSFTNGQGYVGPNPYGPAEPSFANSTLNFCVDLSACSQAGNLSEENFALFGIVTQNKFACCAVDSGIYKGSVAMANANVYLGDRRNPTLTGGLPGDSPWRDDNDAVSTVSPRGRDDGLGLYSFTLSGAASGNGTQRVRSINDPNQDCSGSPHYLPCPANGPEGTTTFGYRLNEGINNLSVSAQDAVENPSGSHTWIDRIDRTKPEISTAGSLDAARDGFVGPNNDYVLTVTATDGDAASLTGQRSGVTAVTAKLDGAPMTDGSAAASCTRPEGSCALTINAKLTGARIAGLDDTVPHTIEVTATDALNHTGTDRFTLKIDRTPPTVDTNGALDEASDEDRVRDSPDLTVTATDDNDDPNITTSGVVNTKVIFNDNTSSPANKSFSQSCTSGCSLTHTFQFDLSSLPEGNNTVDVVTTDGAGNQDNQSWNFVKDSASPRPSCSDPSADPNNCQPSPPSSSRAACNPSLPLGAVTTARSGDAVDFANQNYPGLLSDSDAVTREGLALKPTLTGSVMGIDPSSRLASTGTLTLSEIMSLQTPSYTVGSGLSGVCVRDDSVVATDRRVTDNNVAYGTTAPSVDTILRPSVFGMMEFQQIRDPNAPTTFASTIDLTPGQYVKQLEDGSIAVIDPSLPTISSAQPQYDAAATPDEVGSSDTDPVAPSPQTDAGPPALASSDLAGLAPVMSDLDPTDTAGHYEDERELLDSADQKTDGQAIAVIAAPSAQDSSGTRVPASQTIATTTPTSAVITTTYDHKSALYSYPVYGQRSTSSSGNKRGHHAVAQGLASGEHNGLIAHNSQNEGAPKLLAGLNGQMLKYVMPRYDACEPYQSLSDLRNAPAGTPCRAAAKWVQQALNIQSKQPSKHIKLFVSAWWGPVGGALDPATAPSRGSGRVAVAFQHIWNKAPFNKVDFWSPMNEPNLAVQQDGGDPAGGLAAHVFKRTRSASRSPSVGCHGHCRIVAGELDVGQQSVHKTFSDRFFAGLTSTAVPYWSVHDYSDVTYGNQKASAKCPVRSPKPECKRYEFPEARLFVKRLRDARPHSHIRLLFSEQAPAYVIGGRSTNVLNGSRQEQINAAKRFQSIRTLFPEVTNVDFYELFGAQGFDSGVVVPRDPRPRLADSDQFRPAYCQLTGESQSNCTSVP